MDFTFFKSQVWLKHVKSYVPDNNDDENAEQPQFGSVPCKYSQK